MLSLSNFLRVPSPILPCITRKIRLIHSGPLPPQHDDNGCSNHRPISDHEWDIRTGRAIYVLQKTLPDFFQTGLVSSVNATGVPSDHADDENIYSPQIRLVYTPPVALPSPFPRTLSIEGLPLYMASSVFIRHTMKALYSDLHVELGRLTVQTPSPLPRAPSGAADSSKSREKTLFIGLTVLGTTRVSGGVGEWKIDSTYSFSPVTGLINIHTINSIQPAPHQAVYDALRASLNNVFGLGGRGVGGIQPGEAGAVNKGQNMMTYSDSPRDGTAVRSY